jgi:CheY-like chemotaxis protein
MGQTYPILVVDDDPLSLRLLTGVLRGGSWTITACSDAQEALRLVAVERYRAVVCDLDMPGGDGLDILRAVRFQDPRCALVLVTAHEPPAADPRPDLVLRKPVDGPRLRAWLAALPDDAVPPANRQG